jgi:hypothetical protein
VYVRFARAIIAFTAAGISYDVLSMDDRVAQVRMVEDRMMVEIPEQVECNGYEFRVANIHERAFSTCPSLVSVSLPASVTSVSNMLFNACPELAAIEWNASTQLSLAVPANPNLLLYVTDASLSPEGVKNLVVNGLCDNLVLCDTTDNVPHGFYAPRAFIARHAEYSHTYTLETPMNSQQGWETLALPFDVQAITHEKRGEIAPFAARGEGDTRRPFWLYGFGTEGYSGAAFTRAATIMAYRPYLIAMPNNQNYKEESLLAGRVTFSADNVEIAPTVIEPATYGLRLEMVPVMQKIAKADTVYALNIGGENDESPGSVFVRNSRDVQPFQCYIALNDMGNAPRLLSLQELLTDTSTDLGTLLHKEEKQNKDTYDLRGVKTNTTKRQTWRQGSRILLNRNMKFLEKQATY